MKFGFPPRITPQKKCFKHRNWKKTSLFFEHYKWSPKGNLIPKGKIFLKLEKCFFTILIIPFWGRNFDDAFLRTEILRTHFFERQFYDHILKTHFCGRQFSGNNFEGAFFKTNFWGYIFTGVNFKITFYGLIFVNTNFEDTILKRHFCGANFTSIFLRTHFCGRQFWGRNFRVPILRIIFYRRNFADAILWNTILMMSILRTRIFFIFLLQKICFSVEINQKSPKIALVKFSPLKCYPRYYACKIGILLCSILKGKEFFGQFLVKNRHFSKN